MTKTFDKRYPPQIAGSDGWSPWVAPVMSGYRMRCCDCGLVHELEFQVIRQGREYDDGTWAIIPTEGKSFRVMMRAKRSARATAAVRRKRAKP